jgi:predicted TIM-barrel fold metal-dependent hydrolase
MFPYYALAQEFNSPVGIHTGLSGPNNLSPNYDSTMGNPGLMENILIKYPGLRVWIMHAGAPYLTGTLAIMAKYPNVYLDISVIDNPDIVSKKDFHTVIKLLIDAGFEDRIMFGSDNAGYAKIINAVKELDFLTAKQKEKIFYINAQRFFRKK